MPAAAVQNGTSGPSVAPLTVPRDSTAAPEECAADRGVVPRNVNLFDLDMKHADVLPGPYHRDAPVNGEGRRVLPTALT